MNNKIEFTDNDNKEIERIILEKGKKMGIHFFIADCLEILA